MPKYSYPVIFEPNENNGLTVTFPDLPGCITEGDDTEEALLMAAEATALHLYGRSVTAMKSRLLRRQRR